MKLIAMRKLIGALGDLVIACSVVVVVTEVLEAQTAPSKPATVALALHGQELAQAYCAGCHGVEGNSPEPQNPKIAGQKTDYLQDQLRAFKSGARKSDLMSGPASAISDGQIAELADYYSGHSAKPGISSNSQLAAIGAGIYRSPSHGAPPCAANLLQLAASLERSSEHPLAMAVLAAAKERNIANQEPTNFQSVTGKGVTGKVGNRVVALGNKKLMTDNGIELGDLAEKADELRASGATALFVGVDGKPGGVIAIADPIKSTTRAALDNLRADGIHIVMLTGDNKTTAEAVGRQLGIDDIQAEVLPEDKNRIVKKLRAAGKIVAMAGDGVNDAPALAQADVGIAMGTGTEVAMQSAGVTLVKGNLAGIARARALSRMTMGNIRENLVFAFAYNAIGIPIAAGVLYPNFGILLSPVVAALAMSLSSVSVIGNALRLRASRL